MLKNYSILKNFVGPTNIHCFSLTESVYYTLIWLLGVLSPDQIYNRIKRTKGTWVVQIMKILVLNVSIITKSLFFILCDYLKSYKYSKLLFHLSLVGLKKDPIFAAELSKLLDLIKDPELAWSAVQSNLAASAKVCEEVITATEKEISIAENKYKNVDHTELHVKRSLFGVCMNVSYSASRSHLNPFSSERMYSTGRGSNKEQVAFLLNAVSNLPEFAIIRDEIQNVIINLDGGTTNITNSTRESLIKYFSWAANC